MSEELLRYSDGSGIYGNSPGNINIPYSIRIGQGERKINRLIQSFICEEKCACRGISAISRVAGKGIKQPWRAIYKGKYLKIISGLRRCQENIGYGINVSGLQRNGIIRGKACKPSCAPYRIQRKKASAGRRGCDSILGIGSILPAGRPAFSRRPTLSGNSLNSLQPLFSPGPLDTLGTSFSTGAGNTLRAPFPHRACRPLRAAFPSGAGRPLRPGRGDVKRKVAITLKNQGEIKNKRLSHYAESRPGKTGRLFCVVGLERRKIFLVEN